MHRRPSGGSFIPVLVPAGFNLFRCLSVIFTGGLIEPHFFDNGVCVKRGKMRMEPGGDREIVAVACAGIFVRPGVEFDEGIAWMKRVRVRGGNSRAGKHSGHSRAGHFLIYIRNK
jgi:hypothetical protein